MSLNKKIVSALWIISIIYLFIYIYIFSYFDYLSVEITRLDQEIKQLQEENRQYEQKISTIKSYPFLETIAPDLGYIKTDFMYIK